MERERLSTKQVDSIMNKNSGMLGLTETSNDMREIEEEAFRGSSQHKLALDIYCHRLKKYIGAYMAVLGGVDGIVFTGGIGEKSFYVRETALSGMEKLGIAIDSDKNKKNSADIGTGKVKILVIPTNEELAIARDAKAILESEKDQITVSIPEEDIHHDLALLTENDKAELVLLWAKDPGESTGILTRKLINRIGKNIRIQSVERELEILGLHSVSKARKEEMKKAGSNDKNQ
jgi:acetate kinase